MSDGLDLLKALGLDELKKLTGKQGVKAGVLEGATNSETGTDVAMYAACNEFGTSRIPSRPFMRNTFDENADRWADGLAKAVLNGRPARQALQLTGMRMADDIVKTISDGVPPPNAPATVERKTKEIVGGSRRGGSHQPGTLVDTGSLINSINYEVFGE